MSLAVNRSPVVSRVRVDADEEVGLLEPRRKITV